MSHMWWSGFAWGAVACFVALIMLALWLMTPHGRGRASGSFSLDGRVVTVTGAASGLGLAFCKTVLESTSGCSLHLIDVNAGALAEVVPELEGLAQSRGSQVTVHVCDVCDTEAFEKVLQAISQHAAADGRHCSVLVNNACIVHGKDCIRLSVSEFEKTVRLGTIAQFTAIKAFLPEMRATNDGMIVTVASLMGLLPGCKLVDYCTSKYGSVGLHESLSLELAYSGCENIHTLLVCPYVIDTGMFAGAFQSPSLWVVQWLFPFLKTQDVVDRVLLAMKRREYVLVMPWILTLAPYVLKAFPIRVAQYCLHLAGACTGMDTFHAVRERM